MPSSHRRIAVVRDPVLDRALRRAAPLLGKRKPAATLVRELALRGAEAIAAEPAAETIRRLAADQGARPAEGSITAFLEHRGPLGSPDPSRPRRASELLEELRGERLP